MLFAGAIVASVGIFSYANGRAALRESAAVNVASIALEKEAALESWREERLEDITGIAGLPSTIDNTEALIAALPDPSAAYVAHENLVQELQSFGGRRFLELLVIEPDLGMIIASTERGERGKLKENRPYFLNGKNGPYVQNPYYSFHFRGLAMTFSAPILSQDGTLLAVLAGRGDLTDINGIVTRSSGLYQSEDVYIVDSSSLLLTQPRFIGGTSELQRGIRTEVVNRCLSKDSGSLSTTDYRGVSTLAAYRWLSESQICLVVKVDQAEAYGPVDAFRNKAAIFSGLVLAIAALLGFGLATSINRPLLAMQKGVLAFRRGDLDVRLPETSPDELGDLSRAFNEMATERGRVEHELQEHRQQLERLVQERTAELEREVVERTRAEEELRSHRDHLEEQVAERTQNLARSNRTLQDFANVASHDLQEPLRKVRAFGDLLRSRSGDALSDQSRDYLDRMQGAVERMQTLIDDLLSLSRVTTQRQPLVPVDLSKVAQEVLSDLEVRIEESGGEVDVGPLPTIQADPTQMHQLLQNLVGNALKFHKNEMSPLVKIRSRLLSGANGHPPGEPPPGDLYEITVEDNGIGFDEIYADRIFTAFQRLHSRESYDGTGIGLAICRNIVERHGGSITASSTLESGSIFTVSLPVHQNRVEETP